MNADPLHYFGSDSVAARSCESCGSASLTTGFLAAYVEPVEMLACDECGDFWFERAGRRLTAATMRELGLLSA